MSVEKFEKEYIIKSYEADKNGNLRLVTLMNILQDMADSHAIKLGFSIETCLAKGLAWIGSNYALEINKLPKWHEKIHIQTWPAVARKYAIIRDFIVYNEQNEAIIKASSQWILINHQKKTPVSLHENLDNYEVIPQRAINTDFPKIKDLNKVNYQRRFLVRFDDIDVNNHVNNAVYPLWASESLKPEFRFSHTPQKIDIIFKKEGLFGEDIQVESEQENLTSVHCIKSETDGRELAKVQIIWRHI